MGTQKSIQELYEYPFIPSNPPTGTTPDPWDEKRPMQQWARPLKEGEDPMELVQFHTYMPLTPTGTEAVRVAFFMRKGEAAKYNIVPWNHEANVPNPGDAAYFTQPPQPFPMRELEVDETLTNTPFGLILIEE